METNPIDLGKAVDKNARPWSRLRETPETETNSTRDPARSPVIYTCKFSLYARAIPPAIGIQECPATGQKLRQTRTSIMTSYLVMICRYFLLYSYSGARR